ncbi:MAG: DUF4843 domain-containing protein [Chitinophagaceae bacterium]
MNKRIYILLLLLPALAFLGCRKNVLDPAFRSDARLLLTANNSDGALGDSLVFSFAIWPNSLRDTVVNLYAQVMGTVTPEERTFTLQVDPASTAQPSEYVLPTSFKVPGNGFRVAIPVKINRTARLTDASAKLVLRVMPDDSFLPGPVVTSVVNSGPVFSLIWTDVLTKPVTWDNNMLWSVGKWSKVKHQLVIDATGIRNFQNITIAEQYYIASRSLEFLTEYNRNNPGNPKKNENGVVIDICSQCE